MTTPATPRPPPPTATAPPLPRRSSTCDGSSRAPGRNFTQVFLQVAQGERDDSRCEDQTEVGNRPCEERCARLMRSAKRAELQDELCEPGRIDRQAVQGVLVQRVEREHPGRQPRDVLEALRLDGVPD